MKTIDFPTPTQRSVVIERVKLDIESTLILPDGANSPANEGIVICSGPQVLSNIKQGMRVCYNNKANQFIVYKEKKYILLHENDVYAEVYQDEHGVANARPFNKTILVRKENTAMKMGNLWLPETQRSVNVGTIVSIGDKVENPDICIGRKIIFNIFADQELMLRNIKLNMIAEVDVFCLLPDDSYSGNEDLGREKKYQPTMNDMNPDVDRPLDEKNYKNKNR